MIFYTALRCLRHHIKKNLYSQNTKDNLYIALTSELWSVYCQDFREIYCNITTSHCIRIFIQHCNNSNRIKVRLELTKLVTSIWEKLITVCFTPGHLFTKWWNLLRPNLVKPQSREIVCYNDPVALKLDRHLGNAAADVPVKFQSDWKSINLNLAVSRLHEILW